MHMYTDSIINHSQHEIFRLLSMAPVSCALYTHPGISRKIFANCAGYCAGNFAQLRGICGELRGSRGKFHENAPKYCVIQRNQN